MFTYSSGMWLFPHVNRILSYSEMLPALRHCWSLCNEFYVYKISGPVVAGKSGFCLFFYAGPDLLFDFVAVVLDFKFFGRSRCGRLPDVAPVDDSTAHWECRKCIGNPCSTIE